MSSPGGHPSPVGGSIRRCRANLSQFCCKQSCPSRTPSQGQSRLRRGPVCLTESKGRVRLNVSFCRDGLHQALHPGSRTEDYPHGAPRPAEAGLLPFTEAVGLGFEPLVDREFRLATATAPPEGCRRFPRKSFYACHPYASHGKSNQIPVEISCPNSTFSAAAPRCRSVPRILFGLRAHGVDRVFRNHYLSHAAGLQAEAVASRPNETPSHHPPRSQG